MLYYKSHILNGYISHTLCKGFSPNITLSLMEIKTKKTKKNVHIAVFMKSYLVSPAEQL